jgi:thymidylate synthase
MFSFECDRLSDKYPNLIRALLTMGEEVDSRAGLVRELAPFALTLLEPAYCVVDREGFNPQLMAVEITMLLAGEYDPKLLSSVSKKAAEMIKPRTAYGPRVKKQLLNVEAELKQNPDSRRAVVYIGLPTDLMEAKNDQNVTAGEMPCTCLWQFLVRDDALCMVVYMRSFDAVWGLCYDIPCFVSIQMALARSLNVDLGQYYHHAGSFHIYERHWNIEMGTDRAGTLTVDTISDSIELTQKRAEQAIWRMKNELRALA